LVDAHTSLGYLYLTVRGIAFDAIGIIFNNVVGAPFVPESLQDWLGVHPSKSVTYEQRTGKAGPHLGGGFEAFYKRRMYGRIRDCWGRPVAGASGDAWIEVMKRERVQGAGWWRFWERDDAQLTLVERDGSSEDERMVEQGGESLRRASSTVAKEPVSEFQTRRCLNLGSYNYLGFGGATFTAESLSRKTKGAEEVVQGNQKCVRDAAAALRAHGVGAHMPRPFQGRGSAGSPSSSTTGSIPSSSDEESSGDS
jgi:hypothetical protein